MSYKLATAYVEVQANSSGLTASFSKIRGQLNGLLMGFVNMNPALGAIAGITGLTIAMHQLMAEAQNAFDAETRLDNVLKTTGRSSGVTKEQIIAMSKALQESGISGSTEILKASNKLVQMGGVTKDTYAEIIQLSADVAAAGFGTVESAASSLARAMNDPASGMRRLRSIGLVFTKDEQKKIKALTTANNLLGAQRAILDKVARSYGGMDKAMAKTPAGQWKQIKNQLSDVSQEIGMAIYPAIVAVGQGVLLIAKGFLAVFKTAVYVNDKLGGWPVKIGVAVTAMLLFAEAIAVVNARLKTTVMLQSYNAAASWVQSMGGLRDLPALFGNIGKSMKGFIFGIDKVDDLGLELIRIPGLVDKVKMAFNSLSVAITSGTLMTGWGAPLVLIGVTLAAITAGAIAAFTYFSKFPKVVDEWNRLMDIVWITAGQVWQSIQSIAHSLLRIVVSILPDFIRQLPMIKKFLDKDIVGGLIEGLKMAQVALEELAILGVTVMQVIAIGWENIAAVAEKVVGFLRTASEVALTMMKAMISTAGILGQTLSPVIDELTDAIASLKLLPEIKFEKFAPDLAARYKYNRNLFEIERKNREKARKASKDSLATTPAIGGNQLDTPMGLTGLQDAWKVVQEALLKGESPAERTARGVESLKDIADQILTEISGDDHIAEPVGAS